MADAHRAKAMNSEEGYLTSSGKPKCTTSQSTQLKDRRRVCPSVVNVVSSIPRGQRAVASVTAASRRLRCVYDFRCKGSCMYTVDADVPLDSVLVLFCGSAVSFRFCGAASVQTICDSGVVCASHCNCGPRQKAC